MILCHSRKFIFVHLHKTAGSSVNEALQPLLAAGDYFVGDQNNDLANRGVCTELDGLKKHSPAKRIARLVGKPVWKSYFTFAFVRHPFDRLISLYEFLNRVKNKNLKSPGLFSRLLGRRTSPDLKNLPDRRPWNWPGMKALLSSNDFSSFIRSEFLEQDQGSHTQAQSLTSKSGELLVDFVGKYENIEDDWIQVCKRLQIECELKKVNSSPRQFRENNKYGTQSDLDFVVEKYKDDFELFDYTIDVTS